MNAPPAPTAPRVSLLRTFGRISASLFIVALLLFVPGSCHYWQGWAYFTCHVMAVTAFVIFFLFRDPQLLARRLLRKEKIGQQKIVLLLLKAYNVAVLSLCALDHRLGWTSHWAAPVPAWLSLLALVLIMGCQFLFVWVVDTNRFAAAVIQVEPGQKIVDAGPYHYVRHPMYAGGLVQAFHTPLALGSLVVWPLFVLLIPILVWRLLNEENLLRQSLPGYPEYCRRTRYRLLPGVW